MPKKRKQPQPAHVRIVRRGDKDIHAALGQGTPTPTGGGGGWTEVARPDDVSMTEWNGSPPFRFAVPILLDGHAANRDQQPQLNRIWRVWRGRDGEAPETVRVMGAVPFAGRRVVLENVEYSDRLVNPRGVLVRQALTLHFMEFVPPDQLKFRRRKAKGPKTTKVKAGENLRKVSTRVFDGAKQAKAIGRLNGIRDVRKTLKTGRVLKLP